MSVCVAGVIGERGGKRENGMKNWGIVDNETSLQSACKPLTELFKEISGKIAPPSLVIITRMLK